LNSLFIYIYHLPSFSNFFHILLLNAENISEVFKKMLV
jgi:hypothetical protein